MSIASVIVGYLGMGLLIGAVNCLFKTRLYRRHPSSRLVPPDNAAGDFLFSSMFLWPWLITHAVHAARTGSQDGQAKRR